MRRVPVVAAIAAVCIAACAPAAMAQMKLSRSVVGNGGAPATGTMTCNSTAGQAAIGLSAGASLRASQGFWAGGLLTLLSVDDGAGAGAGGVELAFGSPAPNPTRGVASFALSLPAAAQVRVRVVDVTGRQVSVCQDGRMEAGRHTLAWAGRDPLGRALAVGVYFVQLEIDGRTAGCRTVVLVR